MTITLNEALSVPGLLLYRGPSMIDGSDIAVILTFKPGNPKLGGMAQTWIIRADIDPITASRNGDDSSICGDCAFKGIPDPGKPTGWAKARGCYVNLLFRPLPLFKALRDGKLLPCSPREAGELLRQLGIPFRAGAYGDPVAAPEYVHRPLIASVPGHTAYSHQWRNMALPRWSMASADNLPMARDAWSRGYRTFRVIGDVSELDAKEILCPASEEAGKRTTCAECKLCAGTYSKSPKSIAIVAHGGGGSKQAAKRIVEVVA